MVLGLTIAVVALAGCHRSSGEIPGLQPPPAQQTASTGEGAAANPTAAPSPSEPTSTAESTTGGTSARLNRSLAKNSIYAADLGDTRVSCTVKVRSPKPPLKDANLAAYGKKLVGCLVKAFAKPLAAYGIDLTAPKIKTYRNSIKTPCGRFGQRGAPAYYCSITRTIYWPVTGDNGAEAYTFARLGVDEEPSLAEGFDLAFTRVAFDESPHESPSFLPSFIASGIVPCSSWVINPSSPFLATSDATILR